MGYAIRMGIPEMEELWNSLQKQYRDGSINKKDRELYKKWGNALKKLSEDPMYPSLRSHEIEDLSRRYGMKVWQSYLENKKSGARRMYWHRVYFWQLPITSTSYTLRYREDGQASF